MLIYDMDTRYGHLLLYNKPATAMAAEERRAIVATFLFYGGFMLRITLCGSRMSILAIIERATRYAREQQYV